jgi:predicted O-methyltransferase YrrM
LETLGHITSAYDRSVLAALIAEINAKHVIEVGCYVGLTTRSLVDINPGVIVHAIDHFEGNADDENNACYLNYGKEKVKETFCENLADVLFDRVFLHVGTSEFYARVWPFQVDVVFLDANHSYEEVCKDIQAWSPHVRPGGFLCGHDYNTKLRNADLELSDQPCGVKQAVDELSSAEFNGGLWRRRM